MPPARWKCFRLVQASLWVVALGLFAGRASAESTSGPSTSFVAIPSGVADPDRQTVYVTGANDALTALDLATGQPRWETKDAQLALAVAGDRVIARTSQAKLPPNSMQIVVLDAATGNVQMRCRPIVFPEWVAVGGGLGMSFEASASVQDNELTLIWHAARNLAVAQGKATPEMVAAAKKSTTGLARVNLDAGDNQVAVDPAPRRNRLHRDLPFYDVADKRLTVTERTEKVDGGVQLVHRTLEARDQKTGRPLWHQPIAGEVYLPVAPQPAVSRRPTTKSPQRR